MEICYFSNFKAKSNLRKCTESPEPSLIAEMRNDIEIRYISNLKLSRVCDKSSVSVVRCSSIRVFIPSMFVFFFFFFFWNK